MITVRKLQRLLAEISTRNIRHKQQILKALKIPTAEERAVRTATLELLLLTISKRKVVRQSRNIL